MSLNVGKELAELRRLTVGELRSRYAELFGEPTNVVDPEHAASLKSKLSLRMPMPNAPPTRKKRRTHDHWRSRGR